MEELLSCKKLNLFIILGIAKAIEVEYDYALSCFYDNMMNLEIIEAIERSLKIFCRKTITTFKLVEQIKHG